MTATYPLCEIQPHPDGPHELRDLRAGHLVMAMPGDVEAEARVVSCHANGAIVEVATRDGSVEYFAPLPGGER